MGIIKLCVKETQRAHGAVNTWLWRSWEPQISHHHFHCTQNTSHEASKSQEGLMMFHRTTNPGFHPEKALLNPRFTVTFQDEDSHQQHALMVDHWLLNKTCILFVINPDSTPAQRKGHGRQRQDTCEESKQAKGNLAALAESPFLIEKQRIWGNPAVELSNCYSKVRTLF